MTTLPRALAITCLFALTMMGVQIQAPHTAQAEIIDRVAARVNNDIVTIYDIRQAATPFLLQRGLRPNVLNDPQKRGVIYKQILADLIERRLLVQEARKLNLTVSSAELNQWLAYTRRQQGLNEAQFKKTIAQYGMSYLDYKEMVRQNLLRVRITRIKVGSKVSVSDAEVEAVYRARYGEDGLTEKYITVSHILVQPKSTDQPDVKAAYIRIKNARDRVINGESFAVVAEDISDGPSAKKQGLLGTYRKGELDPEFEAAAFPLKINTLSDIVRTKFGFHVILVTKTEQRANPNIAERKDAIRGELQQKAMKRQLKAYIQGLKAKSFVKVNLK